MKKVLIVSTFLLFGFSQLFAQTTQGFNYQAVIRDENGDALAGKKIGLRISILQGSFTGGSVYTETFEPTTNNFGIVNLGIGNGEAVSGNFSTIDWSTANYFIKVELDAKNTGSYTEMGTSQLLSVPYANYAFSGNEGKSAYQTWLDEGNIGSEQVFIDSLKGPQGEVGPEGKSSYEVWLDAGNTGTEAQYIDSITGSKGDQGLSSYQVWLEMGYTGTQQDYIDSITGPQGVPGLSAYQVWLALGNTGTETDFIKSLTGPSGTTSWVDSTEAVSTSKKVGIGTNNPVAQLQVNGPTIADELALFEVKNAQGKTVFAVYENDVKVYLEKSGTGAFTISTRDTNNNTAELLSVSPTQTTIFVDSTAAKGAKGGFAVSGRTSNKAVTYDIMSITNGLTEFYVDTTSAKGAKGGFAVSGRTSNKGDYEILNITADSTRFYINTDMAKGAKGGFAVSGRTSSKAIGNDIFKVTPNLTEVFVNETAAKGAKGGFAVSGRTSSKAIGTFDILHVQPSSTDIYIKSDTASKSFPDGFSISGYNNNFTPFQLFNVSELGTVVNTSFAVAPKLSTNTVASITNNSATGGGKVVDNNNVEITEIGIIYNLSGDLTLNTDFTTPAVAGKIVGNPLDAANFSGLIMSGLTPATQYQVRSYATNADGLTGYGSIVTFTTLP